MPLPTPILDDRSYQQLRDELIRRIPIYTPEWTDHNATDPGITLLELFSFLGENLLFRFNQIPETTRLAFLRLLQIPLRAASAARTVISLSYKTPPQQQPERPEPTPRGTEVQAGALPFETLDEVVVWPATVLGMARLPAAKDVASLTPELRTVVSAAMDAHGALGTTAAASPLPALYETRLVPEQPALPSSQPVDLGQAIDGLLWVAVLLPNSVSTRDEGRLAQIKEQYRQLMAGRVFNLGIIPNERIEGKPPAEVTTYSSGISAQRLVPVLNWEISSGAFLKSGTPVYSAARMIGDTTRGFTQPGVIRVQLPERATLFGDLLRKNFEAAVGTGRELLPDWDALQGVGEFPPVIDDEQQAKRVLFWLRAGQTASTRGHTRLGELLWIGANGAEVVQTRKAAPEFLGVGTGQPDQRYALVHRPVLAGSLILEVEESEDWRRWTEVDGFHASTEDDRHFMIDADSGEVRFGDGARGYIPQIGQRIRVGEYRYGGGPEGNVAPDAIRNVPGNGKLQARNPLAARGGAPAESTDAAMERIPGELRRRDRAVTATDFRELALATPGADLGRTECLPRFFPRDPGRPAPGVVSVMIWPREDLEHPFAPMPHSGLLRSVCAFLDERRLVTTELYVTPPFYRKVEIDVAVKVKSGYGVEGVRSWVEQLLFQYTSALPPYGPEGQGWPLGKRLFLPELLGRVLEVEGVEYVAAMRLIDASDPTLSRRKKKEDSVLDRTAIKLLPYEVPELCQINVVERDTLPEEYEMTPLPAPDQQQVPVPLPPERDEC